MSLQQREAKELPPREQLVADIGAVITAHVSCTNMTNNREYVVSLGSTNVQLRWHNATTDRPEHIFYVKLTPKDAGPEKSVTIYVKSKGLPHYPEWHSPNTEVSVLEIPGIGKLTAEQLADPKNAAGEQVRKKIGELRIALETESKRLYEEACAKRSGTVAQQQKEVRAALDALQF